MNAAAMEPMRPQDSRQTVENLAVELVAKSHQLAGQIRPEVRHSIGELVRSMNCYYSNFIEGHNTHPRDIEKAMIDKEVLGGSASKRALQLEARAHIEVQRMIDTGEDPAGSSGIGRYTLVGFTVNFAGGCLMSYFG